MNTSSMNTSRRDEWSALLLSVMKTSLSVAHELGLSPDAVLDCAAGYLRFRDFASLASGMHGASRADACCARRGHISAVDLAYIKTLAARVDSDRNALARLQTAPSVDVQHHQEASGRVYEKVSAAVMALKNDVQRAFSQGSPLNERAMEGVSGFARALTTITPADEYALAYERAVTAILVVRFAVQHTIAVTDIDVRSGAPILHPAQGAWMQRVKDIDHHPARMDK